MKLHLEHGGGRCVFTSSGRGYLEINQARHESPLLVMGDTIEPWEATAFEALAADHFAHLLAWKPEIVLLGTGGTLRFPARALTAPLAAAGVGLEVMDTRAACRTFNVLAAEGRRVLAAVFLE
jgi:uncharacterized protein